MIAAFVGWNDAGNAATAVIDLLIDVWEADELDAVEEELEHLGARDEDGLHARSLAARLAWGKPRAWRGRIE